MATLNIKGFPKGLYDRLQRRAKRERRSVAQEVIQILDESLSRDEKTHSIMELKGLGKEVWEGVDPSEYIRKERESWER